LIRLNTRLAVYFHTRIIAEADALLAQARAIEKQRRLLQRYVREARGQRKRAFTAWVANLAGLSEHHKESSSPGQQRKQQITETNPFSI
jgi:hypothetical protein